MGLCVLLLAWDGLQHQWLVLGQWGLGGLSLLGLLAWQLKGLPQKSALSPRPALTAAMVQETQLQTQKFLQQVAQEIGDETLTDLKQRLVVIAEDSPRSLRFIIAGAKRTGKTRLLSLLTAQAWLLDYPPQWYEQSFEQPESGLETELARLQTADLILWVVNGDLGDQQWQALQHLQCQYHRLLLVFNKQDQYPEADRSEILLQLQQQCRAWLSTDDIIVTASAPQAITVRRYLMDGSITESQEFPPPQVDPLVERLQQILTTESATLRLAQQWRAYQALQSGAQERLNQARREKALPLIEQYQWLAGGTALVNPVASIDLLATLAINAQMVLDLGKLYQQRLSLAQAQTIAATLGEVLLKLGLAELSSQAIAALLKSQPLTYVAGGALQGLSASYLTRIAGLSLVEYFQAQPFTSSAPLNPERLQQAVEKVFAQTQRLGNLQAFIQGSWMRLQQALSPAP
ncbi:DUF697 domain-containing protein [Synechocystis sp. LKSZ1]|uniref:DUF697 domain-containing protein n=1 Tax=Synechocystis sp. LKSZ1 TaxID=3144951 RepID=UPI00336BC8DC